MASPGRRPRSLEQKERGRTLASQLKAARIERYGDIAIEAFAAEARISPNTLRKLEGGEGNPGFFTVADLASFLELRLDQLAYPKVKDSR